MRKSDNLFDAKKVQEDGGDGGNASEMRRKGHLTCNLEFGMWEHHVIQKSQCAYLAICLAGLIWGSVLRRSASIASPLLCGSGFGLQGHDFVLPPHLRHLSLHSSYFYFSPFSCLLSYVPFSLFIVLGFGATAVACFVVCPLFVVIFICLYYLFVCIF